MPAASAGAIFHASISSGKIPRNDLPDHANRHLIGEFALLQLRPAGVIEEMARSERHVEIAGFPDRLAVVDRLQHGEQPGVTLQHARQRIEMTRATVTAKLCPRCLRGACGADRRLDIGSSALRDARQRLARGRLGRREVFAGVRRCELAGDEMPERGAMPRQPGACLAVRLRRGAILHGLEIACDAHRWSFIPRGGD
ncbi:hypothetical protein ACVIM9_008644 [Bradyrhizobium sp. USDA 4520]